MTEHNLFYYPYASVTNAQPPLLKVAALWFDKLVIPDPVGASWATNRQPHSLEGQALWARMEAARGHCHKIENVYGKYLDPWFQRVTGLDKAERDALSNLFKNLSDSDGQMISLLDRATSWLSERSSQVLDLYESGQVTEANKVISSARSEILPVRKALARTLARLQELEADFISMGNIT